VPVQVAVGVAEELVTQFFGLECEVNGFSRRSHVFEELGASSLWYLMQLNGVGLRNENCVAAIKLEFPHHYITGRKFSDEIFVHALFDLID